MPSNVEVHGPCERKLSLALERPQLNQAIERQFREFAKTAEVKGFRKGKVPRRILEKKFGDGLIKEIREKVVWEEVRKALVEHDLKAMDLGDIDIEALDWEGSGDVEFTVDVDVRPEIDLGSNDYRGLEISPRPIEITEEEIDNEVEQLRHRLTTIAEAGEGPVGPEDYLLIDITHRFVDGTQLPVMEGRVVDLKRGLLDHAEVEDLKSFFLGKMVGEKVAVPLVLPDSFDVEERRGQTSQAQIEITGIRRETVPEIDDAFLEKVGCESVEDLRSKLHDGLQSHREREQRQSIEQELVDRLLERSPIDVPEKMLEATFDSHRHRLRHQMEHAQIDEVEIQRKLLEFEKPGREGARKSLQVRFLLDRIAELEGVRVSQDDLSAYVSAIAQSTGQDPSDLVDQISERRQWPEIAGEIARQKARKALRDHAKSTDLSQEDAPSEAAESEAVTDTEESDSERESSS